MRKPRSRQADPRTHAGLEQRSDEALRAYAAEQRGVHRYAKAKKAEEILDRRGVNRNGWQRCAVTVPALPRRESPEDRWERVGPGRLRLGPTR